MPLTEDRAKRINELIDWLDKTERASRHDALEVFAKNHGVTYETIKEDAMVLGYAVTPPQNLNSVPRSKREDVVRVRTALKAHRISPDAASAAFDFIMKNPLADLERLNRLYPLHDIETISYQTRIAELVQDTANEKVRKGTHPVRAQSEAWRDVGNKIHREIETAVKEVPRKDLDRVVKAIWETNFLKMQTQLNYAKGDREITEILAKNLRKKDHGGTMPVWWKRFMEERYGKEAVARMSPADLEQRLINDYKNLRRHQRPGKERALPRDFKKTLERVKDRVEFLELQKAGQHYKAGDTIYQDFKRREEERLPQQLWSRRKRR